MRHAGVGDGLSGTGTEDVVLTSVVLTSCSSSVRQLEPELHHSEIHNVGQTDFSLPFQCIYFDGRPKK